MKKISISVLLSLVVLIVNAQIQRDLGELALGSSMTSVEQFLAANGVQKVDIGLMQRGNYAFDSGVVMAEGSKKLKISFLEDNPYKYVILNQH